MRKVLIAMPHYSETCTRGYRMLKAYGCKIIENHYDRDYTVRELQTIMPDVEGVIADSEKWCEETLTAAPKLKVIARFGTGMDSVDVEAAKRHGVIVTNCPGLNANTVAEQAIALIFCALRKIPELDADTKRGGWSRVMFHELCGKTVGIMGFGAIGQKVAEKLQGFNCNIITFDKFPNFDRAKTLGVSMMSFEEVAQKSDVISLHMPLLPDTRHIINAESLRLFKDGVLIVNTARGALVDEGALAGALRNGKVSMFAADVFEQEPPAKDVPLFLCRNYICTPHIAGETFENREKTGAATAAVLIDVFEGREPPNRRA
ncbi:MAG: phosphoglycerate dehydrogenase [Eubacteriales bacterium]|nr:phosphoglycerate dehydrogenase [Eubacteriales bacterium]